MHDFEIDWRAEHRTLTAFARDVFELMPQGHLDDLCNAIAGMGYIERKGFVDWMVDQAPKPMPAMLVLTPIQVWWLKKLETGVMLNARPEDGWQRELTVSDMTDDYIAAPGYVGANNSRRGDGTTMGRFLKKVVPGLRVIQVHQPALTGRIGRGSPIREYHMPTLAVARGFWMELHGAHHWTQKIVG